MVNQVLSSVIVDYTYFNIFQKPQTARTTKQIVKDDQVEEHMIMVQSVIRLFLDLKDVINLKVKKVSIFLFKDFFSRFDLENLIWWKSV